ncbi:OLC1v1012435C2 [Oldenlandia corymbosa var. corymbosa]|uniref:OLC1v1012435C2 n=1 Tax=Oldenlandia corymbosa var. corymbosa TaxID=529605 RepID=A0AAV1DVZ6_OLDCO|nr:OLC1v1012435C2 [Oldenlandia corymbosa var. corymbosa]
MGSLSSDKSEIAFFDVETTVPTRQGQGFAILEFGAILVCPRKLIELESYSTLIQPSDLSLISNLSVRCNGITRDAVVSAPTFADIADKVYDILHGRIWAGHNILRFDCARIREAFAEINRPPPEPKGTIDSLALLTQRFGRRAGNMKMASLATYFGIGEQTHRSLDDVRMNLEVLKYCATVLFLESSLPDILTEKSWVSPNATTRSRSNGKTSPEERGLVTNNSPSSSKVENCATSSHVIPTEETHPIFSLATPITNLNALELVEPNLAGSDPFDLGALTNGIDGEPRQSEDMEEVESGSAPRESSMTTSTEGPSDCVDFLEPHQISIPSISAILAPFYRGTRKVQILHGSIALQICCRQLKVRFGISTKYLDSAGRPRLSFVVDASPSLCEILDSVDKVAQKFSDSGSNASSDWRPSVTRKEGYFNYPTVRLHLPTIFDGNMLRWATEIYQKESSTTQRLVFSKFDVAELDSLFTSGKYLDAYFTLDPYDFHQNAGIRLDRLSSAVFGGIRSSSVFSLTSLLLVQIWEVTSVWTETGIIEALNSDGPRTDIILAEVNLLMANEGQMLRYILHHKDLQHIPIIIIATRDQVALTINGLRLGAADYLLKPLQPEELSHLWMHIRKRKGLWLLLMNQLLAHTQRSRFPRDAAKLAKIVIPTAVAESKFQVGSDDSGDDAGDSGTIGCSIEVYYIGPTGCGCV